MTAAKSPNSSRRRLPNADAICGCHKIVPVRVLAIGLIVGLSILAKSQEQSSARQWDAGESGLVDLISKGNPALANWPATQIVSPPIEVPLSSAADAQNVLTSLADQIPQWGPYFEKSGRSFRAECRDFVESLDALSNSLVKNTLQQLTPLPELDVAFQFNPSPSTIVKTFGATNQPASVKWDADSRQTNSTRAGSQRRLRLRLGRSRFSVAQSAELEELFENDFTATFAADALDIVYVRPGRWFSSALVSEYKNGAFKSQSNSRWWGATGLLGLNIRGLVIARNPRFSIQLDKRTYVRIKEVISAGGTIVVGPFIAGSSGSRLTFDDASSKITSAGTGGTYVIAVLNQVN
jgi:hypothetical protein